MQSFGYEILYLANELEPEIIGIQFWPVAPYWNDRVVFASLLHVLKASVNKRKRHFCLTGYFSPSSDASSWQKSLHHIEIWHVFARISILFSWKHVCFLSIGSAQFFKGNSMLFMEHSCSARRLHCLRHAASLTKTLSLQNKLGIV